MLTGPDRRIWPLSGSSSPASSRSRVVLPAPEGPSTQQNPFSGSSRLKSRSTVRPL